jgi:hypothetical protein
MKVGKVNTAHATTTVRGESPATLYLVQMSASGKSIKLGGPGKSNLVQYLNADRLDGKHAGDFLPKTGKAANADKVDGRHARQLRTISRQCQNSNLPAGSNWDCTMTITIPTRGYLLMSGSVDIYETGAAGSSPWCTFSIDGTTLPASHRYLSVDQFEAGICSSEIRGQRGAGTYTVTFHLGGVASSTYPDDGSAWVLFVPA